VAELTSFDGDEEMTEADEDEQTVWLIQCHKYCLQVYARYKKSKKSPVGIVACAADLWFALFYIACYVLEHARLVYDEDVALREKQIQRNLLRLMSDIIRCVDDALKAAEADSSAPVVTVLPHVCQVLQQVAEFAHMGFIAMEHQKIMRTVTPPVTFNSNTSTPFEAPIRQYHRKFPNAIISQSLFRDVILHFFSYRSEVRQSFESILANSHFSSDIIDFSTMRIFCITHMLQSCCLQMFEPENYERVLDGTVCSLVQVLRLSFDFLYQSVIEPKAAAKSVARKVLADDAAFEDSTAWLKHWPVYLLDRGNVSGYALLWERGAGFALCALKALLSGAGAGAGAGAGKSSKLLDEQEKVTALNNWRQSLQLIWHQIHMLIVTGNINSAFGSLRHLILFSVSPGRNFIKPALVTFTLKQLHCREVGRNAAALELQKPLNKLWSALASMKVRKHRRNCIRVAASAKKKALRVVCSCPQCSPLDTTPSADSNSSSSSR
jgi:hypothetical protein